MRYKGIMCRRRGLLELYPRRLGRPARFRDDRQKADVISFTDFALLESRAWITYRSASVSPKKETSLQACYPVLSPSVKRSAAFLEIHGDLAVKSPAAMAWNSLFTESTGRNALDMRLFASLHPWLVAAKRGSESGARILA